jgi:anti-anti-sigma regulatory factor
MEQLMTIATTHTFDCGGAQIRAYSRHLATVVTVRGEIDALNVDRVNAHVRRFVVGSGPVVLDMSGVTHFAPVGISLLYMVDEDSRAAGEEWTLVSGPAVSECLGEHGDEVFPTARSVHRAVRNLADAIVRRRQLMLPLIKKSA